MSIGATTPATRWESYGTFPVIYDTRRPKAIMTNEDGNVTLVDESGNSVTFTLLGGVVYQLRPAQITSTAIQGGVGPVHALFD
jgi:hypothetical protein